MAHLLNRSRRIVTFFARRSLLLVTLACLMPVRSTTGQSASGLAGAWEGQMLLGGNWRFMEAQFGGAGGAKVDLPQERREFLDFETRGNRVRWTLARGSARIRFDGALEGNIIRGSCEQNGVAGEFQLVRVQRTSARGDPSFPATYRTAEGAVVTVARFDFGDGIDRLAAMDTRDRVWGVLLPISTTRYMFAPARSGRFPTTITIEFSKNAGGPASELILAGPSSQRVIAGRIDVYETHAVTFNNGDIKLAGDILQPRGGGPRPAVVMIHSSGNQSRNGPVAYFRLLANLFATNGFVVLVYDKRGVGESSGSWPSASFDDLAGDVKAAVEMLRRQPEVDSNRIGLWSLSQGGWIAPLVAAEDPGIAFLLLVSGAASTPAQQEMDRVATVMRADGAPPQDIEGAQRYLGIFFDAVVGRQSWQVLQSAMSESASQPWTRYVPRPQSPSGVNWTPAPANLDPQPLLRRITAPVLTLHGSNDIDVPAVANSLLYSKASNHSASVHRILDGADHYMLLAVTDPDRQYRLLSPDYLEPSLEWLRQIK